MKNKGFTLVEMLGVMTLLVVIFAFIYPNVIQMLEKGKETDYAEYESSVFLATEAYVNSDTTLSSQLVNEGDSVFVTYSDLLTSGFLSSKLVNPKTNKSAGNESDKKVTITVTKDKTFTYTIE